MQKGQPVELATAIASARDLIAKARRPLALVSSWGSNEELAAFKASLASRFACRVKADHQPEPGEVIEDDLLIKADKNPNGRAAHALFPEDVSLHSDADLVLVWGEGCNFAELPPTARIIFLNSWLQPENGHADVFLPLSTQLERRGHYTNFAGVVSAFEPCFDKPAGVLDAEALFGTLVPVEVAA
jgi:NADH-quinone oxidoreductase subunit G